MKFVPPELFGIESKLKVVINKITYICLFNNYSNCNVIIFLFKMDPTALP
jgi:hypothetical protein